MSGLDIMVRAVRIAAPVVAFIVLLGRSEGQPPPEFKPVSFAILEDYDKGEDLARVEEDFRLFQTLEIDTWRGRFGRDAFEPEPGRYDFDWLRQFAALADRYRIELRPYLAYTPEWAAKDGSDRDVSNDPPADVAAWERFVGAMADALAGHRNLLSFEIDNEPNAASRRDGPPEAYAPVLIAGARAVRSRTPRASVLLGGLTFPDADWLESVCGTPGAGEAFDILPIHAYPETRTPPGVTVENYLSGLDAFLDVADRACGRKSIWINETGFATVPGQTELDQAVWWIRAVATFLAHPRVEHIGIYQIRDLPPDRPAIRDAASRHLGLVRADGRRKLAFGTVDMLTDLLDTGRLAVESQTVRVTVTAGQAGELHHQLFVRPDGDKILIVWDRLSSPTIAIEVPGIGASMEYDVSGRAAGWDREAAALSQLSLAPGVPRVFRLYALRS